MTLNAVRSLEARACDGDSVDVFNTRHPCEVLHSPADEFAAFIARAKAGYFDHLIPADLLTPGRGPAGPRPGPPGPPAAPPPPHAPDWARRSGAAPL